MKYNKPLLLIVGQSGSGKTTIVEKLEKEYGLKSVQSYTTRKPRFEGETGHTFITLDEFENINKSDIVAYTYFDNNHYFATKQLLDESDIYVIDPDGITYMKDEYHNKQIKIIIIQVPLYIRIYRMFKRGDKFIQIIKRLRNDYKKFKNIKAIADNIVINKDLNQSVCEVLNIYRRNPN